ncbi:ReoY family proteolytic degradation factor [Oceanobacillus kimchii]|uniref:UPF0302 protein n=1 Tax=Oceanobacillus kimchii TaxID=746691 RepID=A0ABQ5TH67_9BACI|nr:ReoY family proteolytic degradation factor [Oceanobacillus kimchii]GLO66216.1 UPF0302 protein [Oceanobacillus kimchii]
MVTVGEKKKFIQWFLNNYRLKKRESVWILNYICNHENLLEKFNFVLDDIKFCPRGVEMSTNCTDGAPFKFYKENVTSRDAERAFHDIRLNRDEEMYIQINFSDSKISQNYLGVVVDNPHATESLTISDETENFLDFMLLQMKRDNLMKEIDRALEKQDQDAFNKLSTKYAELV